MSLFENKDLVKLYFQYLTFEELLFTISLCTSKWKQILEDPICWKYTTLKMKFLPRDKKQIQRPYPSFLKIYPPLSSLLFHEEYSIQNYFHYMEPSSHSFLTLHTQLYMGVITRHFKETLKKLNVQNISCHEIDPLLIQPLNHLEEFDFEGRFDYHKRLNILNMDQLEKINENWSNLKRLKFKNLDFSSLKPLQNLKYLEDLDLEGCRVYYFKTYYELLQFKHLLHLKIIKMDQFDEIITKENILKDGLSEEKEEEKKQKELFNYLPNLQSLEISTYYQFLLSFISSKELTTFKYRFKEKKEILTLNSLLLFQNIKEIYLIPFYKEEEQEEKDFSLSKQEIKDLFPTIKRVFVL